MASRCCAGLFNGARIERFSRQDELGHFRLAARKDGMEILALGAAAARRRSRFRRGKTAVDIMGRLMPVTSGDKVTIGDSVTYLVDDALHSVS